MSEKKIDELDEIREKLKKRAELLEFDGLLVDQVALDLEKFNEIKERAEQNIAQQAINIDEDERIQQTRKKIDRLRKRV